MTCMMSNPRQPVVCTGSLSAPWPPAPQGREGGCRAVEPALVASVTRVSRVPAGLNSFPLLFYPSNHFIYLFFFPPPPPLGICQCWGPPRAAAHVEPNTCLPARKRSAQLPASRPPPCSRVGPGPCGCRPGFEAGLEAGWGGGGGWPVSSCRPSPAPVLGDHVLTLESVPCTRRAPPSALLGKPFPGEDLHCVLLWPCGRPAGGPDSPHRPVGRSPKVLELSLGASPGPRGVCQQRTQVLCIRKLHTIDLLSCSQAEPYVHNLEFFVFIVFALL